LDEAEQTLHDLLLGRLVDDQDLDDRVAGFILAAWEGEDALAAVVDGRSEPTVAAPPGTRQSRVPEMYLGAIHVEGFRGIGEPAMLPLRPGPGLTLVTGRNGSGKSSFAEAAELALTGSSGRWSGRTAVWRDGWRNLHSSGPTAIAVDLVAAGGPGAVRIERRWDETAELNAGTWTRQRTGEGRQPFDGSEWQDDMHTYRPFLSYSELGALIDGKPSELYDALHSLLGLGPLTLTEERIRAARKRLSDAERAVTGERKALRAELADVDDERARQAADLLRASAPDLTAVAALVLGADDDEAVARELAQLADLAVPGADVVRAATQRLREAIDHSESLSTADVRSADELAHLLRAALHHHESSAGELCPVCGEGALDAEWRDRTMRRATELEDAASELRASCAELDKAMRAARELVAPMPRALHSGSPIDTSEARTAWAAWICAPCPRRGRARGIRTSRGGTSSS
jgi:DNA repair exonuclease SbcCD ATPase subunit